VETKQLRVDPCGQDECDYTHGLFTEGQRSICRLTGCYEWRLSAVSAEQSWCFTMHLATIDDQRLSVKPRRVVADQEERSACDVVRLT
jgi:hypothetical protein